VGLRDVKAQAINCLDNGQVQHETGRSGDIDKKNLLVTAQVTLDEVKDLINSTKGTQHKASAHHVEKHVEVHTLKPVKNGTEWYIKFYFLEPDIIFISVHLSE
jgi:hypothetical protein